MGDLIGYELLIKDFGGTNLMGKVKMEYYSDGYCFYLDEKLVFFIPKYNLIYFKPIYS